MSQEIQELQNLKINDLSTRPEKGLDGRVLIDREILGVDKWQEILDKTRKEGLEHWCMTARQGGRIITSRVSQGTPHNVTPILPFGIRGLLPGKKEEVCVHSHHMGSELDHLDRSIVSDDDLRILIERSLQGLVILDRGGVHLLVWDDLPFGEIRVDPNLAVRSIDEAIKKGGGTMDVMGSMAANLKRAGIGYYYRDTTQIPVQGPVEFKSLV